MKSFLKINQFIVVCFDYENQCNLQNQNEHFRLKIVTEQIKLKPCVDVDVADFIKLYTIYHVQEYELARMHDIVKHAIFICNNFLQQYLSALTIFIWLNGAFCDRNFVIPMIIDAHIYR